MFKNTIKRRLRHLHAHSYPHTCTHAHTNTCKHANTHMTNIHIRTCTHARTSSRWPADRIVINKQYEEAAGSGKHMTQSFTPQSPRSSLNVCSVAAVPSKTRTTMTTKQSRPPKTQQIRCLTFLPTPGSVLLLVSNSSLKRFSFKFFYFL